MGLTILDAGSRSDYTDVLPEHEIYKKVYDNFYKIVGVQCPDFNGFNFQFSLNIHHALEVCYLIDQYEVDCFVETGTNMGNTTAFISAMFPDIQIFTCETNSEYFKIASERLSPYSNVELFHECSSKFLKKDFLNNYKLPFYFLDAHGEGYWPLKDEIKLIRNGIVCIDDFNINHDGYSWDDWGNVSCDIDLLNDLIENGTQIYTNNPDADYPYPDMLPEFIWHARDPYIPLSDVRLKTLRHSGRSYYTIGVNEGYLAANGIFKKYNS